MLEGEPSWLAVFGADESLATSAGAALSFRSTRSRYALRVDLEDGGTGPAVAEQDEVAVILDGTLLDRGLVVARLGSRRARGIDGDAALLLAAYLELGERLLPLLRGSLALLIWDGRRDTLLCARDPTDSHPLFFSRAGGGVLVSSSYGALLERGHVPADLDRLAIAQWVLQSSSLPRRTFYERIERLPPGHLLAAAPDGVRVRRYWHPGDRAAAIYATASDAVARLEEVLDQAVTRCASLGRLGVLLSGGVDSAVVAASAAAVTRAESLPDPLALSYVYPHPNASEEGAQRALARGLGIPHRIVPLLDTVGADGLLAAALRLSERSWTPCVNPWEPGFVDLAVQGAKAGCRAILSGEGGNDWFDVEWHEAADLIRRLRFMALWRLWLQERRAGNAGGPTARSLLWTFGGRLVVRDVVLATARRVAPGPVDRVRRRRLATSWGSWALPDAGLATALAEEIIARRSSDQLRGYRNSARERMLQGVHLVVPMENRFLFSKRIGVHFLNPAVDPDLVEFLYGLPSSLLSLGGRGKGLPWEIVRRRAGEEPAGQLGFANVEGFMAAVVRTEGPRALDGLGGLRHLAELGIVDEARFARALAGRGLGGELSYNQAWQALACEAWLWQAYDRRVS